MAILFSPVMATPSRACAATHMTRDRPGRCDQIEMAIRIDLEFDTLSGRQSDGEHAGSGIIRARRHLLKSAGEDRENSGAADRGNFRAPTRAAPRPIGLQPRSGTLVVSSSNYFGMPDPGSGRHDLTRRFGAALLPSESSCVTARS